MYRIRSVRESDYDALKTLIDQTGIGFTSLPKNDARIRELVQHSAKSFKTGGIDAFYLFVLEDSETLELHGTSGIYAKSPHQDLFVLNKLEVPPHVSYLMCQKSKEESSELCALYLLHKTRQEGLGKLLSYSRFHYISSHPSKFQESLFADLRGFVDAHEESPFWNAIGRHFLNVDFKQLMKMRDVKENTAFDLMPKLPIYLELLPKSAQASLGKAHPNSKAALEMLLEQGFCKTNEFDIYDGGPRLRVNMADVKTIKESKRIQIQAISDTLKGNTVLISSEKDDFSACLGKIDIENGVIDSKTASTLAVNSGEWVRYSP